MSIGPLSRICFSNSSKCSVCIRPISRIVVLSPSAYFSIFKVIYAYNEILLFMLSDKRVTATSMPPSIFVSLHPFANICRAVLKLHAIRFATHEKADHVSIDPANVFQIQNVAAIVCLEFKKTPQLGDRPCFDSATQDEDCECLTLRCLNPKSHRSRHVAVAPVLHCVRFHPSTIPRATE